MVDFRIVILSGVASLLLSLTMVYYYPYISAIPQPDFYPQNNSWNGLMDFVRTYNASIITDLNDLPIKGSGFDLFIVGPYYNFTVDETNRIKDFLASGGKLIIADNFGSGNSLLTYLGLDSKFSKKTVNDAVFYVRNSMIIESLNSSIPNVKVLAFGPASYVEVNDTSAKVLAWSSSFSYVEEGNSEKTGPFPLIVSIEYLNGSIILVSSPTIFTNYFLTLYDNAYAVKFLANGKVILFTSKLKYSMLYNFWYAENEFIISMKSAGVDFIVFSLLSLGVFITLIYEPRREKIVDKLTALINEHPDWDINILKRLKEDIEK
ncbi:MAG TPA: DUF4350 domain-containing protein [Geobacterales bacterium]|nr:DUF4350 domain-containing protein [Geobacterales bacterium]